MPLFVGIAFAIVAALAVVLLVLPKMGQVGERQDDLEAAENEEITLQVQLRALQDAQAQAPETERQIAEIEGQVPPTADLPTLFRLLQGAADRSAVDFFSFSPGSPLPDATGSFSTITSSVTVSGSYFAIDEFLFLMETLPRAARVTSIAIAPGAEAGTATVGSSTLDLQMTVDFYTTDISAGPGSLPGPTEGAGAAPSAPSGGTGGTGATGAAAGATGATGSAQDTGAS
jgi:Tfp pilus assembly protein PilO